MMKIGILDLQQGDVFEHLEMTTRTLEKMGLEGEAVKVKSPSQVASVRGSSSPVENEDLTKELGKILGNDSNFDNNHAACMYAEMGLSFSSGGTSNDMLISFSCNQIAAKTFAWPHPATGMKPKTVHKLAERVQNSLAAGLVSGVDNSVGTRGLGADEQLVLLALLRLLVRLDGKFSDEEQMALEDLAIDFGQRTFWQMMDEAGRQLPDESAIRGAAGLVKGPEAARGHMLFAIGDAGAFRRHPQFSERDTQSHVLATTQGFIQRSRPR